MSDKTNPDENALVPYAKQDLIIRSSGLAKRGLESLLIKQERIIHFPTDRSMGVLWIYDTGIQSRFLGFDYKSGQILGVARGAVKVPRNKSLKLDVSTKASADLSPLTVLKPTDLEGIQLAGSIVKASSVTDAGLVYIKELTSLQYLGLWGTQVTDAGLAHLKGLTSLQKLDLSNTMVTDAGLAHLKGLTSLQYLDLSYTQVTDAGLAHLKGLPPLQYLALCHTQVSDAGLAHLKGLTSLQGLDLCRTQVTDAGLAHLKGLTSLQYLGLRHTQVSDAGLAHLKGLTSLQWLELDDTQVSDVGLNYLKNTLPNIKQTKIL